MNRSRLIYAVAAVAVVAIIVLVVSTSTGKKHIRRINPAFREYIAAFTTGVISSESTIKVRLANEFADSTTISKAVEKELFSFSPEIKGKTRWADSRTLEFVPEKPLPYGTFYEAKFRLSEILNVPDSLKTLEFQFEVKKQKMEVRVKNIRPYSLKKANGSYDCSKASLIGTVYTADVVNNEELEKTLSITQEGRALTIRWNHEDNRRVHHFQADTIIRTKNFTKVSWVWNGKAINSDALGDSYITAYPDGEFSFIKAYVANDPDQHVVLQFSDPLDPDQNLEGLIKVGTLRDLRYLVDGNELRIYPNTSQQGKQYVEANESLKNINGKKLGKKVSEEIAFEDVKPAIRIAGNGVILPSSNNRMLAFDAVNLKAVDVKVSKIYENNIPQFLQVNELDGRSELSRVSKVLVKKTISLENSNVTDLSVWNRYYIDLSELIETEPGAIYRITLGMKKEYSVYPCEVSDDSDTETDFDDELYGCWNEMDATEDGGWSYSYDYYSDYNYYYDDDYYYYSSYYNDPCKSSYYSGKSVSRNIIASDLGMIFKRDNTGSLTIFVNNIVTTEPIKNADIKLYDYQLQVVGTAKTDAEGKAVFEIKKSPFLAMAIKDNQKGYLKLSNGNSLQMSTFDVGGAAAEKGLKGFIYGERGVWRPGDTLFLSFMLQDKEHKLPEGHPVIFDLVNPRGQVVNHIVSTQPVGNIYQFTVPTDPDAPTGLWWAKVNVGGVTFNKEVRIETIMPNRLKINLDFGTTELYAGNKNKGKLEVKWLHGAVARNLKANIDVTLTRMEPKFDRYPDFVFSDPSRYFVTETFNLFSDKVDENGLAEVNSDFSLHKELPGMLKAHFETRVFEPGGAFSIDRFSLPYYPYQTYIGIKVPKGEGWNNMLETDRQHTVNIIAIDRKSNLQANKKVKVELYKVDWRWWWDYSNDNDADFVNTSYYSPIETKEITLVGGKGSYSFQIDRPDWGRFFVKVSDPEGGHSTGKTMYIDWPGYNRMAEQNKNAASMVVLSTDKDKYNVDDEAVLSFPSPEGCRALISIENGTKILETHWVSTTSGTTQFKFKIRPEMAPNVYANVTILQPHSKTSNDLPIRMYGVLPIKVEDANTHLKPVIQCNEVLRPEEVATITIKEEQGKPMYYTLAIVDEGLLDLTRFKTPDPWNHFYAKEALGVKTWDIYDQIIGAYGTQMERILAIGGDGAAEAELEKGSERANRFKPMVKFIGPVELKKGEIKKHTFMMPQYVGSVRIMCVASNKELAYGSAEKTVQVRKPLMLLATLPRVLGPEETVQLPVSVFATEKSVKKVSIMLQANSMFTPVNGTTKEISFSAPGDQLVNFELKVKDATGVGKIGVYATSGKETAKHEIEIQIRNPNPPMTDFIENTVAPGKNISFEYKPLGMKGTNTAVLEFSVIPPLNLEQRLRYLLDYPHGCVEQTTSAAFPQLYLSDLIETTPQMKSRIEANIKSAIKRIKSFQTADGGLSYWPGSNYTDDWSTSYAGHFMLEAQNKGYTLPAGFIKKWVKYQKNKANQWARNKQYYWNDDLVQAYRLYTLALAKEPVMGAMNRLKETPNLSINAQWRLAAAYALAGKADVAMDLIRNASTTIKPYRELYYTYGSAERDQAMIIETMLLLKQQTKAASLVKELSRNLNSNEWMSTQSTAYCLMAISKYVAQTQVGKGMKFSYSINGSAPVVVNTVKAVHQVTLDDKYAQKGATIKIENPSGSILYAKLINRGIPKPDESSTNITSQNDLKITVNYSNMNGTTINPKTIEQGSDFYAVVTVQNPGTRGNYNQLALSQIFASGWEIHNSRMDDIGDNNNNNTNFFNYQDIRDDRVNTYFDLRPNSSKTFKIKLNAAYLGRFYLPMVYCEAMYDNTINARIAGQWVEVVEAGKVAEK